MSTTYDSDTETAQESGRRGSGAARLKVEFDKDLRTNALVEMIGKPSPPRKDGAKDGHKGGVIHFCPFLVVLGVSALQLLMAYATYCYVTNNMILVMRNPLLTSYEMFVGANATIPHGLVQQVCGDWEDLEIRGGSSGELNHVTMPDGSSFQPSDDYSMFYNLKSPFRTFDYNFLGLEGRSVLDNTLYVIHEGVSVNPFVGGAGYSLLFVLMTAMWLFAIVGEIRSWLHNSSLLFHFCDDPSIPPDGPCFVASDEDPEKHRIVKLPLRARIVLILNIVSRFFVMTILAGVGCFFIMYTTEKISLILNSLAVLFILELDGIIFLATVSGPNQEFIEDLEPLLLDIEEGSLTDMTSKGSASLMPALPFVVNLSFAVILRWWQVRIFRDYFHMTAALCLFAGPTPGDEPNLLNPVTGLCDSLLGVTCAPIVVPNATLEKHGRCVITDQKVGHIGKTFMYLDDPRLFEGRVDMNGATRSWVSWGEGLPEMYEKGIWSEGPYQDIMRKNCLQMYQVTGYPEDRLVDDDVIETMPGAPFYCKREALWKAVFGSFTKGHAAAVDITMKNIDQVAPLDSPEVVAAINDCKSTPPVPPHPDFPYSTNALLLHKHSRIKHKTSDTGKHHEGKKQKELAPAGALETETKQDQSSAHGRSKGTVADKSPSKRRKKLGPAGMLNIEKALLAASIQK